MSAITPNFLELRCGVQYYQWGERRHGSRLPFIAALRGLEVAGDTPFAELWIGAHPGFPAQVRHDGGFQPLNLLIKREPVAVLGAQAVAAGASELPFLLKVLSCEQALSIQAHPDRGLARSLHARDPKNYPDSQPKPELAIALTPFDALTYFRPVADIRRDVDRHPPLRRLLAATGVAPGLEPQSWLRLAYSALFRAPATLIGEIVSALEKEIRHAPARDDYDAWFLALQEMYPGDRGVLSLFFLNLVHLEPGEAIFIGAGEPHSYLRGTIIECMANSDSVVRAGLTAKFVDIEVLLEMLTYSDGGVRRVAPTALSDGVAAFVPPTPDFQVDFLRGGAGATLVLESADQASLLLVLNGEARLRTSRDTETAAPRGSTWLWPACLASAEIGFVAPETEIVRAHPNQF